MKRGFLLSLTLMLSLLCGALSATLLLSCETRRDRKWDIFEFDIATGTDPAERSSLLQEATGTVTARGKMITDMKTDPYGESTGFWGEYESVHYRLEIDCRRARFRYVQAVSYDTRGNPLRRDNVSAWSPITADSTMEFIAVRLCSDI